MFCISLGLFKDRDTSISKSIVGPTIALKLCAKLRLIYIDRVFLISLEEEQTYGEIAERLGLSVKAMEKRMSGSGVIVYQLCGKPFVCKVIGGVYVILPHWEVRAKKQSINVATVY